VEVHGWLTSTFMHVHHVAGCFKKKLSARINMWFLISVQLLGFFVVFLMNTVIYAFQHEYI